MFWFHACYSCQADGLVGEKIIQKYNLFVCCLYASLLGVRKTAKIKQSHSFIYFFIVVYAVMAKFMLELENKTFYRLQVQTVHFIKRVHFRQNTWNCKHKYGNDVVDGIHNESNLAKNKTKKKQKGKLQWKVPPSFFLHCLSCSQDFFKFGV